jgi:hypothetical protein
LPRVSLQRAAGAAGKVGVVPASTAGEAPGLDGDPGWDVPPHWRHAAMAARPATPVTQRRERILDMAWLFATLVPLQRDRPAAC